MKVRAFPYKIIHFDDVSIIKDKEWVKGKSYVSYKIFPIDEDKRELPVMFTWKFRIDKDGLDFFSCIGEGKYLLSFEDKDKDENSLDSELERLISNSLINLEIKWEDATRNTSMFGSTIPSATEQHKTEIKNSIIQLAHKNGLL